MRSRQASRAIFILIASAAALAGFQTVSLSDDLDNIVFQGIVRDSAGAAVADARVVVVRAATGFERAGNTDLKGGYRVLATEPGDYTVKVFAGGFVEESREAIAVTGRAITMDFTLIPAGAREEVTISSSSVSLIDTTKTVAGDTISQTELESLPLLSRDPLELVLLLGGVAEAPLSTASLAEEGRGSFFRSTPEEAGLLSLTGAPATSNNITIDGLDNNDDRGARERISLNPESVAEVQVITNQYAAEYGRASGGRINIRTRGGTTSYRGEGHFFFSDEALNANTFFRNARGLKRVPQQQRREGAVLSGPIQKRKSFFLASYERLDITDAVEIRTVVPLVSNPLFPLPKPNQPLEQAGQVGLFLEELATPEAKNLINTRADFYFSQQHNVSVRFDLLRDENRRGFPGGARLPETVASEGRNSDSISLIDNLVISSRGINQARFQLSRLSPRNRSSRDSIGVIIEDPARVVAGVFTGSESSPAFAREERRVQLQDTLALTCGPHVFKAGGDLQLIRSSFIDLYAGGGQFTFETVSDFLSNDPSRFIQRYDTESRLSNDVAGLFIQDDWKVRPNLTVALGLRWDSESIVNDRDNFSPRIAVAWDPFGGKNAGKTVLRAGFGLFYNRALLQTSNRTT